MNITKLVVKKGLKNISHYSYDFHMFTAIIHHFEGLFGSNVMTSSQLACWLSW